MTWPRGLRDGRKETERGRRLQRERLWVMQVRPQVTQGRCGTDSSRAALPWGLVRGAGAGLV